MTNKRTADIVKTELDRINDQIESAELRLEMAKLEHVAPLSVRVKRLKLERACHRLEQPDDKEGPREFTARIDETGDAIRRVKREQVQPIREEIDAMEKRKRALYAELASGQERMPL